MTDLKITAASSVDREAAWPFRAACYGEGDKHGWMNGKYDHNRAIQAFARHRMAAMRAASEGEPVPAPCMGMAQNCPWVEGVSTSCSCQRPAPSDQDALLREAEFLLDRLDEFERDITDDDAATEFLGHVSPSKYRLRMILTRRNGGEA